MKNAVVFSQKHLNCLRFESARAGICHALVKKPTAAAVKSRRCQNLEAFFHTPAFGPA
jgi:hypothetical protein